VSRCIRISRALALIPMPSQSMFTTWHACWNSIRSPSSGCFSENDLPQRVHW